MAKFKVPPLFLENPNPLDSVLDKKDTYRRWLVTVWSEELLTSMTPVA